MRLAGQEPLSVVTHQIQIEECHGLVSIPSKGGKPIRLVLDTIAIHNQHISVRANAVVMEFRSQLPIHE